ncbi:hypothetical protein M0R89_05560 [Halorussus limi]|uniref:Uncharacterized protein n=1 Tax=Halorussus limi TaxID=2938695 RepID=A0A8U0HWQ9_9EURY|nr:hypothetical protein [Halorussus limi]UPV75532.1 hypothetical protein M0R89_05560 [Halorussus limi]
MTDSTPTTGDATPFRRVSVAEVPPPSVIPADLSVEMLNGDVTSETPATVRVELRWTGDEEVRLEGGPPPLKLPVVDDVSNPTLALVPSDRFDRDDARPECWRVGKDPSEGYGLGLWTGEVGPGDEFACEAQLWTDHRAEGCLPVGRYSFGGRSYVADWDAVAEWEFTLRVSDP